MKQVNNNNDKHFDTLESKETIKKWRGPRLTYSLFLLSLKYFIYFPQNQMTLLFQNTKAHYRLLLFFLTKKNETFTDRNAVKKRFEK